MGCPLKSRTAFDWWGLKGKGGSNLNIPYLYLDEILKPKYYFLKRPLAGEGVEEREPSCTVGGNVN